MKTQIIEENALEEAGEIIRNGGLAAFPTETVYGLGANAFDEEAVKKIFAAKGRPSDNPLIVHIADKNDIARLAHDISDDARRLIEAFMPGPFTIILKKNDIIPKAVSAGLDTVGIRFPSNKTAQSFIRIAGVPVAAPSANLSGKPSPTSAKHVIADMDGRIDAIINGGECSVGVESTIVDASGDVPVLLRPGGVTIDEIREVVPKTRIDSHVLMSVCEGEQPRCPGMKYKHYAPNAEVIVVEGEKEPVQKRIKELLSENCKKTTGVLTMYGSVYDSAVMIDAGASNKEYALRLFKALREFDELGVEVVFAEFCERDGYGLAVKNRLYKSAGYNIIHV
ncbi:MAG: L-threonylcarbamoyladenylate synthase [Clostridiales bacterium]|nr:L-threonylcarbamoyladenylate synthase [Clostridiales bacterium]